VFYYIRRGDKADGPYTDGDLLAMARRGELGPGDLISPDRVDWHKARRYNLPFAPPTQPPPGLGRKLKTLVVHTATRVRQARPRPTSSPPARPVPPTPAVHPYAGMPPGAYRRTSALGVAALVLGIVACLIGWVPILGLACVPFALLGGLLAFLGLVTADRYTSATLPVVAGLLCVLSLALQFVLPAVMIESLDRARRRARADRPHTAPAQPDRRPD
jgi:hypothetical protein